MRHQRQLAVVNARLVEGEQRNLAVQAVAGRLARALSSDDVVAALVEELPLAVGARSVLVATVQPTGELRVLGEPDDLDGATALEADRWAGVVAAALADGQPAWLQSPLVWRGDDGADWLARGGWALAVLPLSGEGVRGVLGVAYPRVHIFAEEEQALLDTVSVLAARALARGRRYDAEHDAAVAFQRAALPGELPQVSGLTIAARYRPAAHEATVGGDWYDVVVIDDHRVLVVVGDVVGHGMEAAAAMGRLRTAFQAIAPLRPDPGAMVQAVSHQVGTIPSARCTTVVCVVIDLAERAITWCRAGHPPPLLLGAAGVEVLDEKGMPPLGVTPDAEPVVQRRTLAAGDALVLYTDGVIERRGEPLDEGLRRIEVVAQELSDLAPEDFSDALVEALVPLDEQADDVVVLVVRLD
jgi:serine phosphatase RsbU (regulator of sigma subunit)